MKKFEAGKNRAVAAMTFESDKIGLRFINLLNDQSSI